MEKLRDSIRELLDVEEKECDRNKLYLYDKSLTCVGFVQDGNLYDRKGKLVRSNVPEEAPVADLIRILITQIEGFVV